MRQGKIDGPRGPIHYAFSGRLHAPTLVLLHPLGADLGVWEAVRAELERFYAVLRIDLPGHGGSQPMAVSAPDAKRGHPIEMAQFATEVLAVCNALGVLRAHFCGISLGGAIALEIALTHPSRVHRLVLANTAPYFPDPGSWDQRIRMVTEGGLAPVIEAMPGRWFTAEFNREHALEIEALGERMRRTELPGYLAACQALKIFDCRAGLAGLALPVLVIAGARDVVTPVEQIEEWSGHIRGADLLVLDAGHLAVMEQPSDFSSALIDFLRE